MAGDDSTSSPLGHPGPTGGVGGDVGRARWTKYQYFLSSDSVTPTDRRTARGKFVGMTLELTRAGRLVCVLEEGVGSETILRRGMGRALCNTLGLRNLETVVATEDSQRRRS
ncbi:hypothetical protein E2C01_070782 [Portunus trituberculatus]|uniref:Uncharacterized protein n=1 Tax=Portunus trituberculatus TaxID=210409 RepID=A0A5B7HY92_PORTR|nr:hypothetical protein [Portunus trituberculatus]